MILRYWMLDIGYRRRQIRPRSWAGTRFGLLPLRVLVVSTCSCPASSSWSSIVLTTYCEVRDPARWRPRPSCIFASPHPCILASAPSSKSKSRSKVNIEIKTRRQKHSRQVGMSSREHPNYTHPSCTFARTTPQAAADKCGVGSSLRE